MIYFGPHTNDALNIVEFVEFVESGGIFRDPRPPLGEVKIIHDMAEVDDYLHVIADYTDDEGWDWRDLLENAGEPDSKLCAEQFVRIRSSPGLMESLSGLMDGPIDRALKRHLVGRYTDENISNISGTIDFIVGFRATFGRSLPFIERLVEIYRLGGHPCGWVGRYPEGRLVAYFPPVDGAAGIKSGEPLPRALALPDGKGLMETTLTRS